jgi:chorismate dehydratase
MSYKVSCVSYLNSKPFIYGLENSELLKTGLLELSLDIPSRCAQKLINKEVQIGLVPAATLNFLNDYSIISKFCIGALGAVNSVYLYSDVPLKDITEIVLDYQSLTSVNLTRILSKHYWKLDVKFIQGEKDYISTIRGTKAGVVIGDRTFTLNGTFNYVYDLSEEWMKFTSLPFVFAVWIATTKVNPQFLDAFESALSFGVSKVEHVASMYEEQYAPYDVKKYLTKYIDYTFDNSKEKALHLYLDFLKHL